MAAGVLDMPHDQPDVKREHLKRWLRDPQDVKPGNYMPTLWSVDDPKRDEEVAAIAEYLLSLGVESGLEPQALNGGND